MRKSLDLDAELSSRLESLRHEEVMQVFEKKHVMAWDNPFPGNEGGFGGGDEAP
jgi:hypothetical protein